MSWISENPVAFQGLSTAIKLVQTIATQIADVEMDHESIVAISTRIDYLTCALGALSENSMSRTLDVELSQLLSGESNG